MKPAWNNQHRCQENVVIQERWSFQTGSASMASNGRQKFSQIGKWSSHTGWSFQRESFQTGLTVLICFTIDDDTTAATDAATTITAFLLLLIFCCCCCCCCLLVCQLAQSRPNVHIPISPIFSRPAHTRACACVGVCMMDILWVAAALVATSLSDNRVVIDTVSPHHQAIVVTYGPHNCVRTSYFSPKTVIKVEGHLIVFDA